MDEDEDYVVNEVEEDEEIEGLNDAMEDEFVPDALDPEDDVLSDYADENESASEDEPDSDVEEKVAPKTKRGRRKNGKTDDWKPITDEELDIKPFKAADKYTKARSKIDQMIQTELKLTQPLSPWHFATTDDFDQFVEDREQWIYNIANGHLEAETLANLQKRLLKLKGPQMPQYTESEGLAASRKQITANMASLQFKVDKRVKPLMNAAQPSGQGGREATLAAAILARKQLQDAAKWLEDEDITLDEEIAARQVKPETKQRGNKALFFKPVTTNGDGGYGPKPIEGPPKPKGVPLKDESAVATGYNRKLIEGRSQRELRSGLGI